MADLPLNPPIVLLVVGLPGAGKSFFARQFSETHNLPYVSENRIRYELFENASFSDSEQKVVSSISQLMVDSLLKTGSSVVYEVWSMKGMQRLEMAKTLYKLGYNMLIVWVQTDEQTSRLRAANRDKRRIDDKISHQVDDTTFDRAKRGFQRPSRKEKFVVISGKYAYPNQQRTVIRRLINMYGGNALTNQAAGENAALNSRREAAVPRRDYTRERTPPVI